MDDRFTPEGISMGSLPFPVLNSRKSGTKTQQETDLNEINVRYIFWRGIMHNKQNTNLSFAFDKFSSPYVFNFGPAIHQLLGQ